MTVITVRNLDAGVRRKIERRAAARGRSMEAEIRAILDAVPADDGQTGILAALAAADAVLGDEAVEWPPRVVEYQRDVPLG
ncbi:MAG: Arc family DNA-binding protein [Bifidobacteriaceae bacterium]|nr:Arc family DNA-binding protein [Bifidobacteriaceae bacterium]